MAALPWDALSGFAMDACKYVNPIHKSAIEPQICYPITFSHQHRPGQRLGHP